MSVERRVGRDCFGRSHVGPVVLAGVGLVALVGSAWVRSRLAAPSRPGELVALQPILVWRSPIEKEFRTLAIDEALARFEVENVGGAPVNVREIESGCGCARPTLSSHTIEPGARAVVEVRATPLQTGERTVPVTLRTDSPVTPSLVLRLQIIGHRPPPYMGQAGGDLSFEGDDATTESREIYAVNLELVNAPCTPPIVTSTSPLLKIGPGRLTEELPNIVPETCTRRYVFKVWLQDDPGPSPTACDVIVADPWNHENGLRIRAHIGGLAPLRAIPSRVVFRTSEADGPGSQEIRVLIVSREPAPDLVV